MSESGIHLPSAGQELRANTIAASLWSQTALIVSVLTLPVLTRALPKAEFGLWALLLSLGALALIADLGIGAAFVRRIAATRDDAATEFVYMRAAVRFYASTGTLLGLALTVIVFGPFALLAAFKDADHPAVTALLVIVAISVNIVSRPVTVLLLGRGQVSIERVFGAGPAIVDSLVCAAAALVWRHALYVAITYTVVEVLFDLAAILLAWHWGPKPPDGIELFRPPWRPIISESWRVLLLDAVPTLTVTVDAALIARINGAASVALFAAASSVSDLVRRTFSPFTESLYVSFCRSRPTERYSVEVWSQRLPWIVLAAGMTMGGGLVATGRRPLDIVFGNGYGRAFSTVLVLLLASTLRTMYLPIQRRLQADAHLGIVPLTMLVALGAHILAGVYLLRSFPVTGAAIALLASELLIEVPVLTFVLLRQPDRTRSSPGAKILFRNAVAFSLCAGAMACAGGWRSDAPTVFVVCMYGVSVCAAVLTIVLFRSYLQAMRTQG